MAITHTSALRRIAREIRPITRKSAFSFAPSLRHDSEKFERMVEHGNFQYLLAVNEIYRMQWKWGPGAEFLFSCIIHALDLEDHEDFIMRAGRPKRGRKQNTELAEQILYEKRQGKNIPQIDAILKAHGQHENLTREAIRDYLKPRRRERKQNKP